MWKEGAKPCSSKQINSTGDVDRKRGFSTAAPTIHSCPQTFHIFCGQLLAVKVNRKALFDFFPEKKDASLTGAVTHSVN